MSILLKNENWRERAKTYNTYTGDLDNEWKNPPAPFNPAYDPKAEARFAAVSASMTRDNFYASHSREECKEEWGRRYDALKASGE